MHNKDWKKDIFTIPNALSLFRLLLIPVYVMIYFKGENLLAAGIFAVSCLTDMIDGYVARHFNMVSSIGKLLDPLADKATQLTMIICLLIKHPILTLLIVFFLIKEIFQLVAASIILRKGLVLRGALLSGKLSTTLLFVSLIVMVLLPNLAEKYVLIISIVDSVALLVAMIDYARAFFTDNPMRHSLDEELSGE